MDPVPWLPLYLPLLFIIPLFLLLHSDYSHKLEKSTEQDIKVGHEKNNASVPTNNNINLALTGEQVNVSVPYDPMPNSARSTTTYTLPSHCLSNNAMGPYEYSTMNRSNAHETEYNDEYHQTGVNIIQYF